MPKNRNRRNLRTFTGIVEHMPHLEELRLEYCNFFESNDVMPFSKLQFLKTLSLRGCGKMKNCVPYLSLACRFGFPKLESLDLRETNVSDGELQCLNAIKSLRELFLEYPELEPPLEESDDDDDFELFLRGPRRPTGQPEADPSRVLDLALVPGPPVVQETAPPVPELPRDEGNGRPEPLEPQPGPSRAANGNESTRRAPERPSRNLPIAQLDAPSSPESLSDSVSTSSSGPEDSPLRTIVIRANINSAGLPDQQNEPRIQVIFGGDVPHARYLLLI